MVIEVTDKKNTLIKKGEALFRLDPDALSGAGGLATADIVTAEHKQRALGAELDEMAANMSRQRPRGINSLKSISVTHAAARRK